MFAPWSYTGVLTQYLNLFCASESDLSGSLKRVYCKIKNLYAFFQWIGYAVMSSSSAWAINFSPRKSHSGPGSNPGRQKLVALLMSPIDCIFYPKLVCASECDLLASLKGYKNKNLFSFMHCIGGSVGRVLRCDTWGHGLVTVCYKCQDCPHLTPDKENKNFQSWSQNKKSKNSVITHNVLQHSVVNYRKHPTFNTVYTVLMAVLRVVRCIIWHSATKYFWKTEAHVLVVRFLRKTLYLLRSDLTQGMQNLWLTFFENIKLTNKALSFASLPLIPLLSLKWMKNKYRRS